MSRAKLNEKRRGYKKKVLNSGVEKKGQQDNWGEFRQVRKKENIVAEKQKEKNAFNRRNGYYYYRIVAKRSSRYRLENICGIN